MEAGINQCETIKNMDQISGTILIVCISFQETGTTFEVMGLQLPIINLPSLKVMFEDNRTYGMPAAVSGSTI